MNIPDIILKELKCSSCVLDLRWGPVYLQHDGESVCGHCLSQELLTSRNKQYEAASRLLIFPCKYQVLGCPETVSYEEEVEDITHVASCEFRQYECPLQQSILCSWQGPQIEIWQHCITKHSDQFVDNPTTLIHDFTKDSLQIFLIKTLQYYFVLYVRVCSISGKIFYSVRFLGTDEVNFYFTLDIKRNNLLITKIGSIIRQDRLKSQEDMSIVVDKNSILNELGGFDNITFTMTVRHIIRACRFREYGCPYIDSQIKCKKHGDFFCSFSDHCNLCLESIPRGSAAAHYVSTHGDVTHVAGSTWHAKPRAGFQHCLLKSEAGITVCWYSLQEDSFYIEMCIPASSEQLGEFRCDVQLKNPVTGDMKSFTPDLELDLEYDWVVDLDEDEFPSWNNVMDVCVDIIRKQTN